MNQDVNFLQEVLNHESFMQKYPMCLFVEAAQYAAERGWWEIYDLLHRHYETEYSKSEEEKTAINEQHAVGLIKAASGGYFEFIFRELRLREQLRNLKVSRYISDANTAAVKLVPASYWTPDGFYFPVYFGGKSQYSLSLHAAVDCNRKDLVIYLLQNGADPLRQDSNT